MLAVQVIEILWTKATRGAPRSNERVALPRAFPLDGQPRTCLVQHFKIAEWDDFQPRLLKSEMKDHVPGSEDVLRISAMPDQAFCLGILGTPSAGQPKRHALPGVVRLLPGEFARLVVNARHTTYSGQYYSETIYNVACGDSVPADRFLAGNPDHDVDLKANLF
ncbi:hypothetical protein [Roseateles sp. P5_E11]